MKWLKSKDDNGNSVMVRQQWPYSETFISSDGKFYSLDCLDLTGDDVTGEDTNVGQMVSEFTKRNAESHEEYRKTQESIREMLASVDSINTANRLAELEEREFWRKLRCDIFLAIFKDYKTKMDACDVADQIVKRLFNDDKVFNEMDKE